MKDKRATFIDGEIYNNDILIEIIEWTKQFGKYTHISAIEQFRGGRFYLTEYPKLDNIRLSMVENERIGRYVLDEHNIPQQLDEYDVLLEKSLKEHFDKTIWKLSHISTDRSRGLGITLHFENFVWKEVFY